MSDCRITIVGAGAAGVAVAKLVYEYARPHITAVDSKGIIEPSRDDLNKEKRLILQFADSHKSGSLADALHNADIFIGVSRAKLLNPDNIKNMADQPIIFAMANPEPEILPDEALKAGAAVVATGRSDFPNQVNNSLAFPGIFRGALDNRVHEITEQHKIAAAEAIAELVDNPAPDNIIPSVLDKRLVPAIAKVIK